MATSRLIKSRTRWRLWIFAVSMITLGGLLTYLETRGVTSGSLTGDLACGETIECYGEFWINVPATITNYLGEKVNITQLCFGDNIRIILDPEEKFRNIRTYKADKRYGINNPEKWKEFGFAGKCLNVGNNTFKFNGTKNDEDKVKWGVAGTNIDPMFLPVKTKNNTKYTFDNEQIDLSLYAVIDGETILLPIQSE